MQKLRAALVAAASLTVLTGCVMPSAPAPTTDATVESEATEEVTETEEAAAAEGTRDNPYPAGSTLTSDDWEVTVGATNLDATEIAAANSYNDPAPEGQRYIQVPMTGTYIGDESAYTAEISTTYVAASGETYNSYDTFVMADDNGGLDELFTGGNASWSEYLSVPVEGIEDGVLRVRLNLIGDDAFVALS